MGYIKHYKTISKQMWESVDPSLKTTINGHSFLTVYDNRLGIILAPVRISETMDETTTTGSVDGYATPHAFSGTTDTDEKDEKMADLAHATIAKSITEAIATINMLVYEVEKKVKLSNTGLLKESVFLSKTNGMLSRISNRISRIADLISAKGKKAEINESKVIQEAVKFNSKKMKKLVSNDSFLKKQFVNLEGDVHDKFVHLFTRYVKTDSVMVDKYKRV